MRYFCFVLFLCTLTLSLSVSAIGKKYYIQLGSCYLQKCVADKVAKGQAYDWPVTVHRVSLTREGYHVQTSMWYDDVDVDVYMAELENVAEEQGFELEMRAAQVGYYLSLGYFESVVEAFQAKDIAEKTLAEDGIRFAMRRLQNQEESSKVLVGPFTTKKKAKAIKREARMTVEFPNAFIITKE